MIRFALAITAIEVVLTLGASLWIAIAETGEPCLTEGEFAALGIDIAQYATECRMRFGSPFSYDTHAQVKDQGPSITISVRVHTPRAEFDARLADERHPRLGEGDEPPSITDEPWRRELGYGIRQRGKGGFRSEIVRLHGEDMLIIRVTWDPLPGSNPGFQASKCERLARVLQEKTLEKLRWRE